MTRPRRRPVAALVLLLTTALVLSGCGFQGLYSTPLPGGADLGNHPYSVKIEFSDVLDLVPQSAVKVNDVPVGKVTSVSLGDDHGTWVADVTISVNGSVHLPADARAQVLQTSLLGEKYVALEQPSPSQEQADFPNLRSGQSPPALTTGDRIPISRTNSAPDVEQVLGALSLLLNEGGLRQIKSIAIELNKALSGKAREASIRDLIGQLNTFTGTLDQQKNQITTALVQVNTLAATLNRQKKIITDALDTFPQALRVLASDRTKLVQLLTSLSNLGGVATRVINASQTQLVTALKSLEPVLTQLTAAGSSLPASLRILLTFPFPIGTSRQFVKGDYANLAASINLNLTDQLCGLLGLCANGASPSATAAASKIPGIGSLLNGLLPSSQSSSLEPMLVGSGSGTTARPASGSGR